MTGKGAVCIGEVRFDGDPLRVCVKGGPDEMYNILASSWGADCHLERLEIVGELGDFLGDAGLH